MARSERTSASSVAERIAGDLEREIFARRLLTGERVALRTELIKRFSVSPGAMNEALRLLRERGVVTVKQGSGGGVFVAQRPPQVRLGAIDLWFRDQAVGPWDLFEARSTLEDTLAVIAAERATPEDARGLAWALEEMREAVDDARAYVEANMRFHAAIVRTARVPVLAGMYDVLVTSIRALLVRAEFAVDDAAEIVAHNLAAHGAILAAIRDGDQDALAVALHEHHVDLQRVEDLPRQARSVSDGDSPKRSR